MSKAVIIISKIIEIGYWITCAFSVVLIIMTASGNLKALEMIQLADQNSGEVFSLTGFEISMDGLADGQISTAFIIFSIALLITSALMAMVFRNIYLIFRTARGETKFSKGATPFQPDTVRMVREIGIFCIAAPVVGIIMSIVARIVLGSVALNTSVSIGGVLIGLVVLSLSQFFAYGAELQQDTDGLI